MSTDERQGILIALPLPARVAGDVVRLILATHSEDDPEQRAGIARTEIGLARRRGLRRRYAAGVGGVPAAMRCGGWPRCASSAAGSAR